ncbi:MAG: phosphatase PAP2 family protein [Thermomicrobiales bacterium]|nr:phosphatase PAP2 family protein [Thermomicrobiales bacterium]
MAIMVQDLLRARSGAPRRPVPRIERLHVATAMAVFFSIVLIDAMLRPLAGFDLPLMTRIQTANAPGLESYFETIGYLTGSVGAITLWALATVALATRRIWSAALAMALMPIGGVFNTLIGEVLVVRTRPHLDELQRTSLNFEERSFPSGHVEGAMLFYGLIFLLARRIEYRGLRLAVQAGAVILVASTSVSRIWQGAHWPSDVLGALLLGGVLAIALDEIARRSRSLDGLPFIRAQWLEHDEAAPHAHALTSLVIFQGETVAKVYAPGLLPRALYWLAFQAPFPYVANTHALWAAAHRRNLAGMLTEYWYGQRLTAGALGVDRIDGRLALVSEFVEGEAASDRAAAKRFLTDLRARFEEAGLPTWQIDPRQPRAVDNVLQIADGSFRIVDLESGLVSPLASRSTWGHAIRRQMVPFCDDLFFDVLRDYLAREEAAMTVARGETWVAELHALIDDAEMQVAKWHASEPRLWHRLFAFVAGGFGIRSGVRTGRALWTGGNDKAMSWVDAGVTRWETEGRLSETETVLLREQIAQPDFQQMMPYLGGHILLSIPLRFPFGCIIRPMLVAGALGWSTTMLLRRKIDRSAWKRAAGIHSPLVMIVAAIPGAGSVAYLASEPIRRNRLMLRVMTDAMLFKLPKGMYLKSGARKWIARPARTEPLTLVPVQQTTDPKPLAA